MDNKYQNLIKDIVNLIQKNELDLKNENTSKFYIIFDKFNKPYLLKQYRILYDKQRKNITNLYYNLYADSAKSRIGHLIFSINGKNSRLDLIEIFKENNLKNNIGTKLLEFFEYICCELRVKTISGEIVEISPRYINKKKLIKFYKANNYLVNNSKITKYLTEEDYTKIESKSLLVRFNNLKFVLLLPKDYKAKLLENMKTKQLEYKTFYQ